MTIFKVFGLALTGAAALAATSAALAQDPEAFGAKVRAAAQVIGYELVFGAASQDGGTVTFDGVSLALPARPGAPAASLDFDAPLTFTGVVAQPDGGFHADKLSVADIDLSIDGTAISIGEMTVGDIRLPGAAELGFLDLVQLFGNLGIGPVSIRTGAAEQFVVAAVTLRSQFRPSHGGADLTGLESETTATGISIDLSGAAGGEPQELAAALGLSRITGTARQALDWTTAEGHLHITEMSVRLDDLARFDTTMDVHGYTPALMDEMAAKQRELTELTDADDTAARAAIEAAIGLQMLERLALAGFAFRYEDASLANRLLDYFAEQQGLGRTEFVAGVKVLATAMLQQLGDRALARQLETAVNAFLDNPQSLEIRLAPAAPISMLALTQGAENPANLIDQLGLSVTANEARRPAATNKG